MRLLSLKGEGLASLAEPFEIDFTVLPLAGAGLFVIAGPTGSGKSTLLDAVSLALFDKFPRLDGATADNDLPGPTEGDVERANAPAAILTRGRGLAYAEVVFVGVDGRTYRSRWQVRRARGKGDGRLQNAEMSLVLLDSDGNENSMGGTRTETLSTIEDVLGLTFEQFTRTVLLAQNRFDAFLTSPESERGELLERITGEFLFAQLSRKVFEIAREKRSAVARAEEAVGFVTVLTDEARANLAAEQATLRVAGDEGLVVIAALSSALQWWATDAHLSDDVAAAADATTSAFDRQTQMAIPRAEAALARSAWKHSVSITHVASLARDQAIKSDQLKYQELACKTTWAVLESASRLASSTVDVLRDAEAHFEYFTPIWTKAVKLDTHIEVSSRTVLALADDCPPDVTTIVCGLEQAPDLHDAIETTDVAIDDIDSHSRDLNVRIAELEDQMEPGDVGSLRRRAGTLRDAYSTVTSMEGVAQEARTAAEAQAGATAEIEKQTKLAADAAADAAVRSTDSERLAAAARATRQTVDTLGAALDEAAVRLRATLEDGLPCPVCGATDHPLHDPALAQAVAQQRLEADALDEQQRELNAEAAALRQIAKGAMEATGRALADVDKSRAKLADVTQRWAELVAGLRTDFALVGRDPSFLPTAPEVKEGSGLLAALKSDLDQTRATIDSQIRDYDELAEVRREGRQVSVTRKTWVALRALLDLRVDRAALLDGEATDDHRGRYQNTMDDARASVEDARRECSAAQGAFTDARARLDSARAAADASAVAYDSASAALASILATVGIERSQAEALIQRGETWLAELEAEIADADEHVRAALQEEERATAALAEHRAGDDRPADDVEALRTSLEAERAARSAADFRLGEIGQAIRDDDENRRTLSERIVARDSARADADVWDAVNDAIGSRDGSKFRTFAQRYTFTTLLGLANEQLRALAPRYRLQPGLGTGLSLHVVDHEMAGEVRGPRSLSGGERFLVALALALALSSLGAGRTVVETLFIDEGFGALDPQSLDRAMEGLEALQTQGRTVGVITHVEIMKERISTQILVEPQGGGRSSLRVVSA